MKEKIKYKTMEEVPLIDNEIQPAEIGELTRANKMLLSKNFSRIRNYCPRMAVPVTN